MTPTLAILGLPTGVEWIVLVLFGLLLFGRRLPEVGRSLGQGIVEFKKGLKGVTDDVDQAGSQQKAPQQRVEQLTDRHSNDAVRQMDSSRSDTTKVS